MDDVESEQRKASVRLTNKAPSILSLPHTHKPKALLNKTLFINSQSGHYKVFVGALTPTSVLLCLDLVFLAAVALSFR